MRPVVSLLISLLIIGFPVQAEEVKSPYRVTDFNGPAAVIPKGRKTASPVVQHMPVYSGDRLFTGEKGRLELGTESGNVIELKEHTDFRVKKLSVRVNAFFLKSGRILARFKKKLLKRKKLTYRIGTPVSIAAVRGTDLAMDVDSDGTLQAGVIEGQVEFDDVVVEESNGIIVEEGKDPVPTVEIPELLVDSLPWFDHVRDRVKQIEIEWNTVDAVAVQQNRVNALKEKFNWIPPDRPTPAKPTPQKLDVPGRK